MILKTAGQTQREWRNKYPERWKVKRKRNRAAWMAKVKRDPARLARYKAVVQKAQKKSQAKRRLEEKLACVAAYGGACKCCGESNHHFLTIDHKDGLKGKRACRRRGEPARSGTDLYVWLRVRRYPKKDYQLLCFNCNIGKHRNGGKCPHEKWN